MSIAAKAFLCASIVFQSTYAAVNRVMTVEVASEGAVAHRVVKGSAEGSIGSREDCPPPAAGKEYTREELELFPDATCLKEIVKHEVGVDNHDSHHFRLKTYEDELVRIHGLSAEDFEKHFENHTEKHLVSLILGIQAAEAVIDAAEDLVADAATAATKAAASEPSMPHTRETLHTMAICKQVLDALIRKELAEHKREIEDYTAELREIDSKTAHFESHAKQDLIAVILAQQAVEAIVETAEQLLAKKATA